MELPVLTADQAEAGATAVNLLVAPVPVVACHLTAKTVLHAAAAVTVVSHS
jgi:hypothetical protein